MPLLLLRDVAFFAAGRACWPLVEYGIHGLLSHRFRTPVSLLHARHHEDPHAVFTPPVGWVPAFAVYTTGSVLAFGPRPGCAFALGTLSGFVAYERFHHHIHFGTPRTDAERVLFEHHMAHHHLDGTRAHGVTTRALDRLLGTMPPHGVAPRRLRGRSNFREAYSLRGNVRTITTAAARAWQKAPAR